MKFHVGDRVRIDASRGWFRDMGHLVGVIRRRGRHYRDGNYLVEFPGWGRGHKGAGLIRPIPIKDDYLFINEEHLFCVKHKNLILDDPELKEAFV